MTFSVTKSYGHDAGFSCCFRQFGATSHCRLLHGYSLAFDITLESDTLNKNNWVVDFGAFRQIKEFLVQYFDHTCVVSHKDPGLEYFQTLSNVGIMDLRVLPKIGCEAFAEFVGLTCCDWAADLNKQQQNGLRVVSVTVHEHTGNSATWRNV